MILWFHYLSVIISRYLSYVSFAHVGHQWVKNNLGVNIKTGWSVDPFGHGPTVPYLLKKSEITGGTVIQRLHYAWKEWFARTQNGDFLWRQNWDRTGHTDTLVHNMPFSIYSIRGSCGPHPQVREVMKSSFFIIVY